MPLFDYCCKECETVEEFFFQNGTMAGAPQTCPSCGGKMYRTVSPTARPVVKGGTPIHYK